MPALDKQLLFNTIWVAAASVGLLAAPAVLLFALHGAQSLPGGWEQVGGGWVGGMYAGYPSLIGVWFAAQLNAAQGIGVWLRLGYAALVFTCGWALYFYTCTHDFLAGFEDQLPAIIAGTVRNMLAESAVAGCMLFPIAVVQGRSLRRDHNAARPGRLTIWATMGWTGWLAVILAIEGFPTNSYTAMVWLANRAALFCNVVGFACFLTCISSGRRWALVALPASVAVHLLGRALWLGLTPAAYHWQHQALSESELSRMPLVPPGFWLLSIGSAAAFLTLLGLLYGACKLSGMRYVTTNAPQPASVSA